MYDPSMLVVFAGHLKFALVISISGIIIATLLVALAYYSCTNSNSTYTRRFLPTTEEEILPVYRELPLSPPPKYD
jgi:hypothetical protein